jgi:23S rRNA (uracil1939-C5)-methyltransferase
MKQRKQQTGVPHLPLSGDGRDASAGTQLVHIEKPIYGGSFLARDEGKAIFVPFALPGEEARVRIVEDKGKRGYATAAVEEIVAAAPERVAAACPHFGSCGGCHYQHADYAAQLRYKEAILRETFTRGGVNPTERIEVLAAEPWGYRNRIRLAFDASGRPGYRAHGSHAVVPIESCPIAAPVLVKAALAAAEILRASQPRPGVSELVLFSNAEESELLATVLLAAPAKLRLEAFAAALKEQIPALTGAELIVEGRAPHSPKLLARWGAESLRYNAAGFAYRVDHGAFFQVNRRLVDALVERVVADRRGELAWDLFAGVGLFARQLAARFSRVIAVESAPFATRALEANLSGTAGAGTGGEAVRATTLDFLRRSRSAARPDLVVPDLVVIDPPRAGLGAEVTAELARVAAPEMVYVSCDPTTLARDLRSLVASGYAIESVTLADLFPQTFHIETIVSLSRNASAI